MPKPQPKQETILLEEDNEDEDLECIRGPYRERIYKSEIRVCPMPVEDNLQDNREKLSG